jgi:hypothetical protein
VIQFALQRTQTGFDVAQTLAIGQLGKGHRQILIPAGEASQPEGAVIACDAATELPVGKKADQLREDGPALIHEPLSALPEFKSRQPRNGFNLLRSYYLQPATCQLTGQQCHNVINRNSEDPVVIVSILSRAQKGLTFSRKSRNRGLSDCRWNRWQNRGKRSAGWERTPERRCWRGRGTACGTRHKTQPPFGARSFPT